MKLALATVLAALVLLGGGQKAGAQPAISADLQPGQVTTYQHRINPRDRGYEIAFRCTVPPLSIGVVTLARIGRDTGSKHDVEVAARLSLDSQGRIVANDIIAADNGPNSFPKVVPIGPPSLDTIGHLVVIHARDNIPATYRVYCNSVSIPEKVGMAVLKTALTALFREYAPSEMANDQNISRALSLAISLAQRDNVLAIGLDMFQGEISAALEKAFPSNPYLVTFLTELTVEVIQEMYGNAFYEMSGFR